MVTWKSKSTRKTVQCFVLTYTRRSDYWQHFFYKDKPHYLMVIHV